MSICKSCVMLATAVLVLCLPSFVSAGHASLDPEKAVSVKTATEKPVSSFAIKFDLSDIPQGQWINMALLKLTFSADTTLGEGVQIMVYVASEEWQESVLARETSIRKMDTLMTTSFAASGDEEEAEFDVTDLVQRWYGGRITNNGFVLSVRGNSDRRFELANQPGQWGATLEVFFSKEGYFSD